MAPLTNTLVSGGPCWPDPDPTCCPNWDQADPDLRARMARVAATILFGLSGRMYAPCPILVRPCGRDCPAGTTYAGTADIGTTGRLLNPHLLDGVWTNIDCGCKRACDCCAVCEILLPGPVADVLAVWWDGDLVDPHTYRVDNRYRLVRTTGDPGDCWPKCQDLAAAHDQAGAFAVEYVRGYRLDPAGMLAYGEYTCQLIKACQGAADCQLPQRVQSITRQGVTVTFEETLAHLNQGRTGLPSVDQWLALVNPHALMGPPVVLSPDVRTPRVTTWGRP